MTSIDSLIVSFRQSYPGFVSDAAHMERSGDNSIMVTLHNGTKLEYHSRLNTIMFINDEFLDINNEARWRRRFQYLLNKKMSDACVDIASLSAKTGIALKTLYNYLNQKSTPSCWNIKRIADALGCDVEELM